MTRRKKPRKRGPAAGTPPARPWTPDADALVLAARRGEGAALSVHLGRTPGAVRERRCELRRLAKAGKTPRYATARQPPPGKKWCPDCHDFLPLGDFYRRAASRDGFQPACKVHQAARQARVNSAVDIPGPLT